MPGVNDLLNGYTLPDGTKVPSYAEKVVHGKAAQTNLYAYRKAKAAGKNADVQLKNVKKYMPYFGYGYVENVHDLVPPINICFWAFRIMVGLGALFMLYFLVMIFISYKKDISHMRWLHIAALCLIPLVYVASEAGWIVAEMGRQPWTIQDMLPTWAAVSDLQSGAVVTTFFIFLVLFTTMLAVEISILCKQIKKGPEHSEELTPQAE